VYPAAKLLRKGLLAAAVLVAIVVAVGIIFTGSSCGCAGLAPKSAGPTVRSTGARVSAVAAGPGTQTNCIRVPSACGYPDVSNTGVPAGTTLSSSSEGITVTKPGTTVDGVRLFGTIEVEADDTTVKDSEIIVTGGESCPSHPCGGHGIWTKPGVTGTIIEDDSIHGKESSGSNVVQYAIASNSSSTRIERVHLYNATEPISGPARVSDSLIEANGTIPGEHYEDIYYGGGGGPLIVNHDTMLNPHEQTAVVFASVDFGDQTVLSITNNLMAGGGYVIYGGASGSAGKVIGPVTVTGNRFSRKYYRQGGFYGTAAYFNDALTNWSSNVWDETLQAVSE
jgi:hypothetical protein